MKNLLLAVALLSLFSLPAFSADSSSSTTSYDDINFPQWTKDLRRTEIITLGSLPFVTIWATVGYSAYTYGEFRNPLNKSSDGLSDSDQKAIMKIAAASCIGLGLTDLAITLIRRSAKKHKTMKARRPDAITIEPIRPDAGEVPSPDEEPPAPPREPDIPQEYLQGGIESALF